MIPPRCVSSQASASAATLVKPLAGAYTVAMLTCGLIIAASFLAQAEDPLTRDYTDLQGQFVEIVVPPKAPLPPGWTEHSRSGRLDRVAPGPPNLGGNALTITWDEPWAAPVTEKLNDTVRDASKQLFKLTILAESEEERVNRIKRGWGERGFEQVGQDPLDPASWIPAEEVKTAKRAQQMARESAATTAPPETATVASEAAPAATTEQKPEGLLQMRLPQLLIGIVALALAGALVKTLVL